MALKLASYDGRPVLVIREGDGSVEFIPLAAPVTVSEEDELLAGAGRTQRDKDEAPKTATRGG